MAVSADHSCEAKRFGLRLYCGRCELVSADRGELKCKPTADTGLLLSVIREAAAEQAANINASIDAAFRITGAEPNMGLLRAAACMNALVRLVDRCDGDRGIRDRLKSGGGNG